MSLNKKVVWLPYDMDTAIGINNSGLLVFSYNLEDTDLQQGGEFIFNGQDSVMWTNLRDAFGDDIKAMYQQLRSSGALSYDRIEQMFETHQAKWSEAIFNEDAFYKYIEPLTNPDAGKQPDASYLPMAQGSKAEQRKWWLYNRFRYMDSKFNAGDTLNDYIMMRAYAVDDQVLTPYADIYLTTSWDGELTQVRATRGQTYTLPCPKDTANDAVVAIYSASQLSSVGDLSGLKIKSGNFSMATKLQSLKIGDDDANYSNTNLTDLQLGNNTLLSVLDVRNCPNLTQTVDLRGCSNIEEVYFDGTSIAAAQLPNGGILRVLHLPDTVTNLTLRNQQNITDFTLNDYSMISTLRLENCGDLMDEAVDIVNDMQTGNIRLVGIDWDFDSQSEFKTTFDKINTCGGLDDTDIGFPTAVAQLQGAVHTPSASSSDFNTLQSRYPYVAFTADVIIYFTPEEPYDLLEGLTRGYYLDMKGLHPYSSYSVSDYLNITGGWITSDPRSTMTFICDANKELVAQVTINESPRRFKTDIQYMRISDNTSYFTNGAEVIPHVYTVIQEGVTPRQNTKYEIHVPDRGYYENDGISINENNYYRHSTEYVTCVGSTIIIHPTSLQNACFFYNENKELVSATSYDTASTGREIPANAKFVRFYIGLSPTTYLDDYCCIEFT